MKPRSKEIVLTSGGAATRSSPLSSSSTMRRITSERGVSARDPVQAVVATTPRPRWLPAVVIQSSCIWLRNTMILRKGFWGKAVTEHSECRRK